MHIEMSRHICVCVCVCIYTTICLMYNVLLLWCKKEFDMYQLI